MLSPTLWLMIALALSGPATYATMKIKGTFEARAAYRDGREAGVAEGRATGLAEADKTIRAQREAEAETPLLADKAAIIERCKRSASCRERGSIR